MHGKQGLFPSNCGSFVETNESISEQLSFSTPNCQTFDFDKWKRRRTCNYWILSGMSWWSQNYSVFVNRFAETSIRWAIWNFSFTIDVVVTKLNDIVLVLFWLSKRGNQIGSKSMDIVYHCHVREYNLSCLHEGVSALFRTLVSSEVTSCEAGCFMAWINHFIWINDGSITSLDSLNWMSHIVFEVNLRVMCSTIMARYRKSCICSSSSKIVSDVDVSACLRETHIHTNHKHTSFIYQHSDCSECLSFNNLSDHIIIYRDILREVNGNTNWSEIKQNIVLDDNTRWALNTQAPSHTIVQYTICNRPRSISSFLEPKGSIKWINLRAIIHLNIV